MTELDLPGAHKGNHGEEENMTQEATQLVNQFHNADLVILLLGFVSLLAGKRLFWLVAAAAGFFFAILLFKDFGPDIKEKLSFLPPITESLVLTVAIIAAAAGVILFNLFKKFAVGIIGFALVGYVVTNHATEFFGTEAATYKSIIFLLSGALGAVLVSFVVNFGLVLISSLFGAHIIVEHFATGQSYAKTLFILVAIFGVLFQIGVVSGLLRRKKKSS